MEVVKMKRVYCPRCGSLVGFQLEETEMPKVEMFKYTVGDKKYPVIDLTKAGGLPLPLLCRFCGYKFNLEGGKRVEP
jgi:rubredoxin